MPSDKGKKPSTMSLVAKVLFDPPPPLGVGGKEETVGRWWPLRSCQKSGRHTPEKVEDNLALLDEPPENEDVEVGPLTAEQEQEIAGGKIEVQAS